VIALIEVGAGLTLVLAPVMALALALVFGAWIETKTEMALAALADSALIALGTACLACTKQRTRPDSSFTPSAAVGL
jgi:hypothetical protein